MPDAARSLVMTGGGGAALTVSVSVAVPVPIAFAADSVTGKTPETVGVPVMEPVLAFTLSPAGKPLPE